MRATVTRTTHSSSCTHANRFIQGAICSTNGVQMHLTSSDTRSNLKVSTSISFRSPVGQKNLCLTVLRYPGRGEVPDTQESRILGKPCCDVPCAKNRSEMNMLLVERENPAKRPRPLWHPRKIRSLCCAVVRDQRTDGVRLGRRVSRISSWRLSAPSERQSNKRPRERRERHVPFYLFLDRSKGGRLEHSHNDQPQIPSLMGHPTVRSPHHSWATRRRPIWKNFPELMGHPTSVRSPELFFPEAQI